MSTGVTTEQNEPDPLAPVRENEASVEVLADRDDLLGAGGRVACSWVRGERPDPPDLMALGLPLEWAEGREGSE